MLPTGQFQKRQHTSVSLGGLAVAEMFGDAARPAVGLGMFVHVRAPTAIPAFHYMVPMALMAAPDIGQLTRPGVGEIGGNANGTGGCAQEIGRLPSVSCALDGELDLLTLLGTLPSEGKGQRFESPRARQ
jgi:hypothetical protein